MNYVMDLQKNAIPLLSLDLSLDVSLTFFDYAT